MLTAFASKINNKDLARPNRYRVAILNPPVAGSDAVTLMAETVSFPAQNIRSVPDSDRFGPMREHAQGMDYAPFSMTFICTTGLPEKLFFEAWQEKIINKETWEPRYHRDYVAGIVQLFALDRKDQDVYKVNIYEAYPKTISGQGFSYSSNSAYQTLDVEFTYRYWESVKVSAIPTPAKDWTMGLLNALIPPASEIAAEWVNPNSEWVNPNSTPTSWTAGITPPATPAQPAPLTPNNSGDTKGKPHGTGETAGEKGSTSQNKSSTSGDQTGTTNGSPGTYT